jgi:Mn2+/Fe2+ NRAMP family transporter
MLCIAAALFHKPGMTGISDLGPIHAHLGTLVGGGAALVFGIALMASGLSSSRAGLRRPDRHMIGFMNWLYRVQIVGHYCTNWAAQAPRRGPVRRLCPNPLSSAY